MYATVRQECSLPPSPLRLTRKFWLIQPLGIALPIEKKAVKVHGCNAYVFRNMPTLYQGGETGRRIRTSS